MLGLLEEPMLLALAEDHAHAHAGVALGDLADEPSWIVPPPPGVTCREEVTRACADAGFVPMIGSETYTYEAILALVATGAVALVPRLAMSSAPDGVRFFSPSDVTATRSIFAAVRHGSTRRPDIATAITAGSAAAIQLHDRAADASEASELSGHSAR